MYYCTPEPRVQKEKKRKEHSATLPPHAKAGRIDTRAGGDVFVVAVDGVE